MLKEFKEFAMRGNVVDMAVGIIIGAAFGTIVKSLVSDVIMPPIGLLLGNVDFTNLFVVLKEGQEGSEEFFEELKGFLKEHIAIYKLPRAIEYVEALPRTPTGKLLRRHLRPPK